MAAVARSETPTLRQVQVPVALVIGGTHELVQAVEDASLSAQVLVADCTVAEATNRAASMRPLVMVMPEDVYAFDPESFEALARDVRSRVLTIPTEGIAPDALRGRLEAVMLEAETLRQGWSDD